jgi:hypothetical protein
VYSLVFFQGKEMEAAKYEETSKFLHNNYFMVSQSFGAAKNRHQPFEYRTK